MAPPYWAVRLKVDYRDFEHFYKQACQFDSLLGMDLQVHAPGKITYRLEITDKHVTYLDSCHGGVIAALMDAALGVTVLSWAIPNDKACSTVEFKLNLISQAKPGDHLVATSEIDSIGSRLVVASAQIIEIGSRRLIAKGMGTFSLYPLSKKTKDVEATDP